MHAQSYEKVCYLEYVAQENFWRKTENGIKQAFVIGLCLIGAFEQIKKSKNQETRYFKLQYKKSSSWNNKSLNNVDYRAAALFGLEVLLTFSRCLR